MLQESSGLSELLIILASLTSWSRWSPSTTRCKFSRQTTTSLMGVAAKVVAFSFFRVTDQNLFQRGFRFSLVAPTKFSEVGNPGKIKLYRVFSSFFVIQVSSLEGQFIFLKMRQLSSRIFIHSSHQLNGKWLCYLSTVRLPRPFTP